MSNLLIKNVDATNLIDAIIQIDRKTKFFNSLLRFDNATIVKSSAGFITNGVLSLRSNTKHVLVTVQPNSMCESINCTISYTDDRQKLIGYENVSCAVITNITADIQVAKITSMATQGNNQEDRNVFMKKNLNKRLSKWKFLINKNKDGLLLTLLSKGDVPTLCAFGNALNSDVSSSDYIFTIYPYINKFIVPPEVLAMVGSSKVACFEIVKSDFTKEDVLHKSLVSNVIEIT